MAISHPRQMVCGVQTVDFEIMRSMSINRLNGGITQVREMGEPRWRASFSYFPLQRLAFQEVQAWLDSLRGGLNAFYAHDPLKPFPLSYPKGVYPGSYTGAGPISAISATGFTLSSMPNQFLLHAGDMVGLAIGSSRGLFRILEAVNTGGGTTAALTVEPRVDTAIFTTGSTAWLSRPYCTMILDPNSISASRTAGVPSPITFSAIQKLY